MILSTTKVEDFDRFLKTFSTKGAEKRKQHGSRVRVFRDPNEDDRVWVLSTGTRRAGRASSPTPNPPDLAGSRALGRPQAAELGGQYDA